MKYLLLPLLFVFYLAPATAQKLPQDAISTYFSEYVDDANFSAVYVSGKIFQLFRDADLDLDDLDEAEIKAILAAPGVPAELDPIGLAQVFTYWSPQASRTCFRYSGGGTTIPPVLLIGSTMNAETVSGPSL